MKRKTVLIGTTAALGIAVLAFGSSLGAQPYGGGWGGYGPGRGYGMMGGYGWGCPWFQDGATDTGGYTRQGNLNLSTDDVRKDLEQWLAAQDNPRLKVGEIKDKDSDTLTADIVTKDNSLVQQFTVDRHTGFYRPTGS